MEINFLAEKAAQAALMTAEVLAKVATQSTTKPEEAKNWAEAAKAFAETAKAAVETEKATVKT